MNIASGCSGLSAAKVHKYRQRWESQGYELPEIEIPLKSRGLGDTVAKITRATGIDCVARLFTNITGKDCGCKGRQAFLNRLVPYPSEEKLNGTFANWAVGITTAPRSKHYTLPHCVSSVQANGWEPIIFSEPGSCFDGVDAEVIQNDERLGLWRNWIHCAQTLLERFPRADAILTIQDDTVFHPQSRWFAERWPFGDMSRNLFSFYTPKHYRKQDPGVHSIRTRSMWGSCALVFTRSLLQAILDHKIARGWLGVPGKGVRGAKRKRWAAKRANEPHKIQNSDTAIGNTVRALGGKLLFPTPSLAEHIADHSADGVGHGGRGGRRSAGTLAQGDLREVFGL